MPDGLLQPLGAAGGLATTLGQGTSFFPDNRRQPYAQRWSFGFQQETKGGFVVETSYVGNRSVNLPITININNAPAQYFSTSPTRDQATIDYLSRTFPNPFFGLNPQFTGANTSREALLRPYPHLGGVSYTGDSGYSWYHSLQSRLEKRFSQGYTLQISHTWSKAMEATTFLNAFDRMPYESLGDIDRAHRYTGSGIWELPFGKGKKYGSSMHRVVEFFAGNWQLNGVYQHQSGAPLGWGQTLYTGNSSDIALTSPNRGADRWFNTDVFYKNNQQQLASNVRTHPLRFSNIRADSQRRWDFGIVKTFKINERYQVKFRADTFNALNEVVLRGPDTNPTSTSFGRVTAQEPPRSWQFQMRLLF